MIDISKIKFEKLNGLVPAIIVDKTTEQILMLGFMNEESFNKTLETKKVTFFSRSRNALWTKGESSGNYLELADIKVDCDDDTLLVYAHPTGPTCHTGDYSCFKLDRKEASIDFLGVLFELIKRRKQEMPKGSYTTKLFESGTNRIIQKVGEEAIETVIAAKNRDKNEIVNEVSDLIYHLFVMLTEQGIEFSEIVKNLESRHK